MRCGILVQAVDPPPAFTELVRRVESLGFEHLWVADSSLHARCVFSYLTLAAVHSTTLRLGTGITQPQTRHPAVAVNALATLQEISGGRALLGVGAGDRPLLELGLRPAPVSRVEDMVALARRLFAGEQVTASSAAFAVAGARLIAPPSPPVPIYVAASGPKMLQAAGRVGDGAIVQVGADPRCIQVALDDLAAGAAAADRAIEDLDVSVILYGAIDPDRERARRAARPFAAWIPQTVPRYCDLVGLPRGHVEAVRRRYEGGELMKAAAAAATATEEMVDAFTLSGTPEECRDRIAEIVERCGVRHLTFFPMGEDRVASIERFADAVAAVA